MKGRLRLTEQGEVAFARYAHRDIAYRHLEQTLHAVLRATIHDEIRDESGTEEAIRPGEPKTGNPPDRWFALLDRLSADARASYRGLVYESPAFLDYFREATPIEAISELRSVRVRHEGLPAPALKSSGQSRGSFRGHRTVTACPAGSG